MLLEGCVCVCHGVDACFGVRLNSATVKLYWPIKSAKRVVLFCIFKGGAVDAKA